MPATQLKHWPTTPLSQRWSEAGFATPKQEQLKPVPEHPEERGSIKCEGHSSEKMEIRQYNIKVGRQE